MNNLIYISKKVYYEISRNTSTQFVGLQTLRGEHAAQIVQFKTWARRGFGEFHHNHYDWWAFPIDEPSSKGFRYVVLKGDIEELKKDRDFMAQYLDGLSLLSASWGWDLANACPLLNPNSNQRWQVRSESVSSLDLFAIP